MLRIASVFASPPPVPARPEPPPALPQARSMPPVMPPDGAAKMPPDHNAAQAEAAFALILSRAANADAKPPTPRYEPRFADPLPNLPTVDAPKADAPWPAPQGKTLQGKAAD